jgi:acyl-CoA synthetase (NDP forming)
VQGLRCYASVDEIEEPVDLAIVAVPAAQTPGAIRALGRNGAGFAVIFSGGFAETGAEGRALQVELTEAARESGVRCVGPNSLGVTSSEANLVASFAST